MNTWVLLAALRPWKSSQMGIVSSPTFHNSGGWGRGLLCSRHSQIALPAPLGRRKPRSRETLAVQLGTNCPCGIYLRNIWLNVSSLRTTPVPFPATVSAPGVFSISMPFLVLSDSPGKTRHRLKLPLHLQCICSGAGEKAHIRAGWNPCTFITPNLQ